jgi:hypothetical protein
VGFVVDKVALGQVFCEYFGFPCQFSFHRLLHNYHHLSSGAGTIGQLWPTYQVDSVSPHPEENIFTPYGPVSQYVRQSRFLKRYVCTSVESFRGFQSSFPAPVFFNYMSIGPIYYRPYFKCLNRVLLLV